jgi:hydroxymethylbilane synthase
LIPVATAGDADSQSPIGAIGTSGVFTKALQRALLAGQIDLAVHSLKDLPTEAIEGLTLAALPSRESTADALLSRDPLTLDRLPSGAKVGTGSLRRQSQLLHARPDLQVGEIRGNVETRVAKLHSGEFDAIVLAEAGLKRLNMQGEIVQILPTSVMLPAVGQGALGLEMRVIDESLNQLDIAIRREVEELDDGETRAAVTAERSLLSTLRGGCLAPVGAWGRIELGQLRLTAVVLSRDGRQRLLAEAAGAIDEAISVGRVAAEQLLARGAAELIASSRHQSHSPPAV